MWYIVCIILCCVVITSYGGYAAEFLEHWRQLLSGFVMGQSLMPVSVGVSLVSALVLWSAGNEFKSSGDGQGYELFTEIALRNPRVCWSLSATLFSFRYPLLPWYHHILLNGRWGVAVQWGVTVPCFLLTFQLGSPSGWHQSTILSYWGYCWMKNFGIFFLLIALL